MPLPDPSPESHEGPAGPLLELEVAPLPLAALATLAALLAAVAGPSAQAPPASRPQKFTLSSPATCWIGLAKE